MKLTLTVLTLLAPVTTSFQIGLGPSIKPGLVGIADAQPSQTVAINLDIGEKDSVSRLAIKGMTIDLLNELADVETSIKMPGKNGPFPMLSSGVRKLNLLKEGEFVSLAGSQIVKALKGCWEMAWKKDSPAGSLMCGFEIPEEYQRNEATLPAGKVFMSFSVFTQETLAFAQARKERVMKVANMALKEKNEAMDKYFSEPNPLMRAVHYRKAMEAAERYSLQSVHTVKNIPEPHEVLQLQPDLFCSTRGTVWSKELPRGDQILLGTASLAAVAHES